MSIFENIKRLLRHSAVYGIGHIVSRSINFLLLPLYTNLLPRDEYGVVGLLFTYIGILTIVYTYGLDAGFFRFYILEDDKAGRQRIFSTAFYMLVGTSVLFSGILFFAADEIVDLLFSARVKSLNINLPRLIQMASGILFFDSITFLSFLILRAEERSTSFAIFKLLNVFLNTGSNVVLLIVYDFGIQGIFIANLIASAVTFMLLLPITLKTVRPIFSRSTFKELFAFGVPYIPSNLALIVMDTIDRPFLERLAGIEAAGLYNAGVKLGMFMSLFVAAFRFAWNPFFLSTSRQENAKATFSKVFTYVLLACSIVFLIMSLFIDQIVRFEIAGVSLLGREYWDSTAVVPVIMVAYIFYAAYLNFLIGIYLEKKTKYLPYITIAGMIGNVATNYALIPTLGLMGAAWARLVAYVIMAVALYIVGQRLYYVKYEWGKLLRLAALVIVAFWVGQFELIATSPILKIGLFVMFLLALFGAGVVDRTEIRKMRELMGRSRPASGKSGP